MGKNTDGTTKYGPVVLVQLLLIAGALVTPLLAFNFFMDLELFSVFKTTSITFFSSIKPWLCPPYVYLLINFIIFFIAASSSSTRSSTPIAFTPPPTTDDNHQSFTDDSFTQSVGPSVESHVFKDRHVDEGRLKEVASIDKRELRKSKTFHEGGSRPRGRTERYVRILSQEELDRRVEAFIGRCKRDTKVQN